ncbi:SRPBCC domain-containing protein [Pedobacter sp. SYP-B3415]|uniref:SRPBCC domain-containing protein n=1 Tax=Pedobacter sp. SYP-B3415 TaxID=2496641 RepID=UPI00101DE038|nr:SRPBCC domain-containing protein [Pedobacter sp. SYP-B3415]
MKDYKKYIYLPVPPEEVYLALTIDLSIKLWTGAEVVFREEAGSDFSLWDGDIVGKNISFEPGKKIVQEWYFGEENEPSVVTIKLHLDKKGTSMEWFQTNIPDHDFEDFTTGLRENYFEGLIDFFDE